MFTSETRAVGIFPISWIFRRFNHPFVDFFCGFHLLVNVDDLLESCLIIETLCVDLIDTSIGNAVEQYLVEIFFAHLDALV